MKPYSRLLILFLIFISSFTSFLSSASVEAEWVRWPSISPDGNTIVFTYKGNLYTVPSIGGDATQITFHAAHDFRAIWNRDGDQIAFASDRHGNFDVYVMSPEGGEATRLTYHSSDEYPYTFNADGSMVHFGGLRQDAVTHRQFPTGSQPELYAVSIHGGAVEQVFTIPVEDAFLSHDGSFMLYHDKKGGENDWRKHHKSAIARDLWKYDFKTSQHEQITTFAGEDRNPVMLNGDPHVYYLSEETGVFNVHRFDLVDPRNRAKLTNFDTHPARFLSAGGGKLAFSHHGILHTLKPGKEPVKVVVNIKNQDLGAVEEMIPINGGVSEMAISPNGKEIAIAVRGEIFVTSTSGALTKRVTNTPWEEGHISWAKDGKSLYYAGEREGKWSIYKTSIVREDEPFFYASTLLEEERVIESELDHYLPSISPDGRKIAWIEDRIHFKVRNLDGSNELTLLDESDLYTFSDGDQSFEWSPDSKWILFDFSKTLSNGEVLLLAADGSKRENLTKSGYYDRSPQFADRGKQVLWLSNRYGMKNYATSGGTEYDVFALFLDRARWDDFQLTKEEKELQDELEKAAKEEDEEDKKEGDKKKDQDEKSSIAEDLKVDWDNLEDRKARLTLTSSSLSSAVLSKDAEKLYYIARYDEGYDFWEVDLREKETKKLMPIGRSGGRLVWDQQMENLYLLSRGSISKVDVKAKSLKGVKIQSDMTLDKQAEMQVLFDHVWLRTQKIFYHSNFHGIDWAFMKEAYEPKISHIANEHEFTEVISEMVGELNVSHAGARNRNSDPNGDETASLGLLFDWTYEGDGLKVAEILEGGPLHKASIKLESGMILKSIDGNTIDRTFDWVKLLNRKEGKRTLLIFNSEDNKSELRAVIKPITLGQERSLLYKRWVEMNRKEVEEKSNGELGYVHIPGMSDEPYRSIYDDMMGRYADSKGVIVDTRFNGGGDLVADLAMFFTGEPFLTYATERKVVGGEPTSRFTKPTLAMINEAQYSDGHCFASGYSDLMIGTTVGMPVPGTCSFAGWEFLSNGVLWGVVPVSAQNKAGEWLENNQTEPDIRVKNTPELISNGRDEQLEVSIKTLMEEVSN